MGAAALDAKFGSGRHVSLLFPPPDLLPWQVKTLKLEDMYREHRASSSSRPHHLPHLTPPHKRKNTSSSGGSSSKEEEEDSRPPGDRRRRSWKPYNYFHPAGFGYKKRGGGSSDESAAPAGFMSRGSGKPQKTRRLEDEEDGFDHLLRRHGFFGEQWHHR